MKNLNNIDKATADLANAVRKNTQNSACIDIFCDLLNEIHNKPYIATAVKEMNHFIEYMSKLNKQIDMLTDNSLKAQILTYDFIKPDRFFRQTLQKTNDMVLINAAINAGAYLNQEDKGACFYDIHTNNKLGNLTDPGKMKPKSPEVELADLRFRLHLYSMDDLANITEDIRKIILFWNYCATIVKAFIQTKRRSLGLDNNSTKFN